MLKPDAGMEAPRKLLSETFLPYEREEGGERVIGINGPFQLKLRAVLVEDGDGQALQLTSFESASRPTKGESEVSDGIRALAALLRNVKDELDEQGVRLSGIDIAMDDPKLSALFFVPGADVLFGEENIAAAKKFHNPTREEEQQRRRDDPRPGKIHISLEDITERLKEIERIEGSMKL